MLADQWVLFDMDGVVTSEDGYRRATACALLDLAAFLGNPEAHRAVFSPDADAVPWRTHPDLQAHAAAQNALLNTNWDQCHAAALAMLLRLCERHPANAGRLLRIDWESDDPGEPLAWPADIRPDVGLLLPEALSRAGETRGFDLIERLSAALGPAAGIGVRKGPVWQWLYRHFQGWFAGTDTVAAGGFNAPCLPKRRGIIQDEELILAPAVLGAVFRSLTEAGWKLGIATGRPRGELVPTLRRFGLLSFFQAEAVTTHDEIARAEQTLLARGIEAHLSKPHPFPFLRSLFPTSPPEELAAADRPPLAGTVVVVGDTVGDMAAAAAIGALPVGVLTGPAGAGAGPALTRAGAKHLLPDVTFLPALLLP